MSLPLPDVKVSAPALPKRESLPEPDVIASLPAPPLIVAAKFPTVMESLPAEPVILKLPVEAVLVEVVISRVLPVACAVIAEASNERIPVVDDASAVPIFNPLLPVTETLAPVPVTVPSAVNVLIVWTSVEVTVPVLRVTVSKPVVVTELPLVTLAFFDELSVVLPSVTESEVPVPAATRVSVPPKVPAVLLPKLTVVAPLLAVKVNAPEVEGMATVARSALNFARAAEEPSASLRVSVSTPVTEPVAPLPNVTRPALEVVSVSEPEPPTIVSPTARLAVIESSPAPPLIDRGVVDPAVIVSFPEPPMSETVTAFGVKVTAPVAALQSNLVVVPLKLEIVKADEPDAVTVADATRFSATELLAVVLTRLVVST